MKPIISSLIIMLFFSSCAPSEAYVNGLSNICAHAKEDLFYKLKYTSFYFERSFAENPEKYKELNDLFKKCFSEFQVLLSKNEVTNSEYLGFLNLLKNEVESKIKGVNFHFEDKLEEDFFLNTDSMSQDFIKLSLTTYMSSFSDIILADNSSGCGYRFLGFTTKPTGFNPTKEIYTFSLLSKEIQEFEHKNFQIDSIFLDNKRIETNTRILPSVCSNIIISAEKEGNYKVFGHMDYLYDMDVRSLPFEHSFSKAKPLVEVDPF